MHIVHDRWYEYIYFLGLMLCYPSVNFFFDKASMVRYIPRITNPRKKKKESKGQQQLYHPLILHFSYL
jgi:hypothetical protein